MKSLSMIARAMLLAENLSESDIMMHFGISEAKSKIVVSKLNSLYSPQDFIDLNTSENGDSKNMTIKLSHGKELLFEMNESRITIQETTNSIIDNESSALFSDESDKLFNESVTRIFEQLNICQEK